MRTLQVGERPFSVLRERCAGIALVSEDALREALAVVWSRTKLVIEPTSALPIAAVLAGAIPGRRIGVILSGGNVDAARGSQAGSSRARGRRTRRRPELARDPCEQRAARVSEVERRGLARDVDAREHDRPLLDRRERETVAGDHEPVEPTLPGPEQLVRELGRAVVQIARLLAAAAREAAGRAAALAVAVLDEARAGPAVDEALVVVHARRVAAEPHPQESHDARQPEVLGKRDRPAGLVMALVGELERRLDLDGLRGACGSDARPAA